MNSVIELIKNAQSIAILAHIREDADAVGSCYAAKNALCDMGKNAVCFFSEDIENHLEFMGRDYSLLQEDNIPVFDLCLCLDCGDMSRLGERSAVFEAAAHTASIDHHETNTHFAEENYVDKNASSTGEILYELFDKMGIKMTDNIAKNLYTAISADTGSFKYSNVSPKTMRIAAKLLEYDIHHDYIARRLYDTDTVDVIKFRGQIMNNIEQYENGRLNIVCVDSELLKRYNICERDTGDVVNIARGVQGCEIAVSIREASDGIKISLRSNGKYVVSGIAEKLGGGGHKMAAGAVRTGKTLDEVKKEIIICCEEVLNG